MVAGTDSATGLVDEVCTGLGILRAEITVDKSARGEIRCHYEESIRGADIFLLQVAGDDLGAELFEILLLARAARLASAEHVSVVLPWLPYGQEDKRSHWRGGVGLRVLADTLEAMQIDRLVTVDLAGTFLPSFFRHAEVAVLAPTTIIKSLIKELAVRYNEVECRVSAYDDSSWSPAVVELTTGIYADGRLRDHSDHFRSATLIIERDLQDIARLRHEVTSVTARGRAAYIFVLHASRDVEALDELAMDRNVHRVFMCDTVPVRRTKLHGKIISIRLGGFIRDALIALFSEDAGDLPEYLE